MLKARITSFLFVVTLLCVGCEVTIGDPDPEYLGPAVIDLSPSPGQTDFYFEDNLHVVFEFAPDAAQLNLLDATETPVSASASISAATRRQPFHKFQITESSSFGSLHTAWKREWKN